ncbi:MAG: hypothetical protein AAGA21_05055 [Pseudomonadota bacterium]
MHFERIKAFNSIAAAALLVAFAFPSESNAQERRLQFHQIDPSTLMLTILEPDRPDPVDPQPLVTTCSAGVGESCASFAAGCLADGGHFDGDNAGGMCCSGVDHPDNNPDSACN